MEKLRFSFANLLVNDKKVSSLTAITTQDHKVFAIPEELQAISHHSELRKTPGYPPEKRFKKLYMLLSLWIKMTDKLKKVYIYEAGKMKFRDRYLEQSDKPPQKPKPAPKKKPLKKGNILESGMTGEVTQANLMKALVHGIELDHAYARPATAVRRYVRARVCSVRVARLVLARHRCRLCRTLFAYEASCAAHLCLRTVRGLPTTSGPDDPSYDQMSHIYKTLESPFTCDICGERFLHKWKLRDHLWSHIDDKPFKCKVCDKQFHNQSQFETHNMIHSGEKPYGCEICKMRFNQKGSFARHRREQHLNERLNQCNVCGTMFRRAEYVTRHMMMHPRQSFKCKSCGQQVLYRDFDKHTSVHNGCRSKPYKCDRCDVRFKYTKTLERHKIYHTEDREWNCVLCMFSTNRYMALKTHMRYHLKRKPFKCKLCKKRYMAKNILERHKEKKHDIPPEVRLKSFPCLICGIVWSDKEGLLSHRVIHRRQEIHGYDTCAFCEKVVKKTDLSFHVATEHKIVNF